MRYVVPAPAEPKRAGRLRHRERGAGPKLLDRGVAAAARRRAVRSAQALVGRGRARLPRGSPTVAGRRRGDDADIPWRRVAASPRLRRAEISVETTGASLRYPRNLTALAETCPEVRKLCPYARESLRPTAKDTRRNRRHDPSAFLSEVCDHHASARDSAPRSLAPYPTPLKNKIRSRTLGAGPLRNWPSPGANTSPPAAWRLEAREDAQAREGV